MDDDPRFEYLNVSSGWARFQFDSLELGVDGSVHLAGVPRVVGELGGPPDAAASRPSAGPAGLAVLGNCDCTIFASDPAGQRIWSIDCDGAASVLPLRGPGNDIGQIDTPRGLAAAAGPTGWRLYIADSANHRVQIVDVQTLQILGVLTGPRDLTPVDVAVTQSGDVFVVDDHSGIVYHYLPSGDLDLAFWEVLSARPDRPQAPRRVIVTSREGQEAVAILDRHQVVFADRTGAALSVASFAFELAPEPTAFAATADAIYVGCDDGTLVRFTSDGQQRAATRIGSQLTTLAVGCNGNDVLAGAGGVPLLVLDTQTASLTRGSLRGGPFVVRARPYEWQRLRIDADLGGGHVQAFTYVSVESVPPPSGPVDPAVWTPNPVDELDVLVLGPEILQTLAQGAPPNPADDEDPGPVRDLEIWIAVQLTSDGLHSPVVRQLRLDWTPPAYLAHLPAIYREGARRPLLLGLMLSLLGSELDRVDGLSDMMTRLFDPAAAPADWLDWLAGWLDFTPESQWSTSELRGRLAQAIELYPWRGTPEGMRRFIQLSAGVPARIEEPASDIALFRLDDSSALGFSTRLAPEHEQGAILSTTAVLGQSSVLDAEDSGAPLFSDIVHRFSVQVYRADVASPATLATVQRVMDAEKPAHTVSHLCVIEPTMRVGFQARLGIDTIVAGPVADMRLGDAGTLSVDAVLTNRPERSNRLGHGARVGASL